MNKVFGTACLALWLKVSALMSVVAALSLLSLSQAAEESEDAKRGPPPAPVVVAEVTEQSMAPTIRVAGTVISRGNARVAAEVEGRLVHVAEVGDNVVQGDVLARLDETTVKLELAEFEAELIRAKARLKFLTQEVKRLKRLATQNNAAQTLLEQTEAERDVARGDLAVAEARLKQYQDKLRRHTVTAPFSGTVSARLLQPGEWVGSGDGVVQLVDPELLEIQAMVPLSSIGFLQQGSEVRVEGNGVQKNGQIRSLVTVGEALSRLLDLRIDISFDGWPVGTTVRVAVPTAAPQIVRVVPRDALVIRRDGEAVFRVNEENVAERIAVQTGVADGDLIGVIGELKVGDRVVTRGGERLRPGQKVNVLPDKAPQ